VISHESKPPLGYARGGTYLLVLSCSGFRDFRDHIFEQDLKCHGMTATKVSDEKLAVTLKDAMIEFYFVGIVITIKGKLEGLELEPISFFCIALGFLNLADHPIVHDFISFL
jgi:hypothetical protein